MANNAIGFSILYTSMKYTYCIAYIFFFCGFTYNIDTAVPEERLTYLFRNGLNMVSDKLENLHKTIATKKTKDIRSVYLQCREAYKQCEFLIEYYDDEIIKKNINAAPLLKLNPSSAQTDIVEPEGFQVLDELIFEEEHIISDSTLKSIDEQVHTLQEVWKRFSYFSQSIKVEKRHLIESVQLGLIRLVSLGITGFDVPSSGNAINETAIVLLSMKEYISVLKPKNKEQNDLYNKATTLFDEASQYCLNNPDFDNFDRVHFITLYAEPLFTSIAGFHDIYNIEYYDETSNKPSAVNFRSRHIFSTELLDAHYFTKQLPKTQNSFKYELGKLLFFDPALSYNNDRSCASCHNPKMAFTDGLKTSLAFERKGSLLRNAPTLINAIFAERFFYDLRAHSFEDQVQHVITNEKEFHNDFSAIITKLASSEEYTDLFNKSFPDVQEGKISGYTISAALASYQMKLQSFNSPVDRYLRGEKITLPNQVKNGFNLFMGKAACGTCHFAPTFAGLVPPRFKETESEILGITEKSDSVTPVLDGDLGRYNGRAKEKVSIYKHSFKTMTIRNVALTAPYFHHGGFLTLEEVVDFYDRGGGAGMGLKVFNQTLPPDKLNLSNREKKDLVTFLKSLTDTTGLTDIPKKLPHIPMIPDKQRKIGGEY